MDITVVRARTGRLILWLLWAGVPFSAGLAVLRGLWPQEVALATALALVAAVPPTLAARRGAGSPAVRLSAPVGLMLLVSVQVWLAPPGLTIDAHRPISPRSRSWPASWTCGPCWPGRPRLRCITSC
ncbi:MAG: hypothetical protein NZM27_12915 [Acetobacteraceae bacterium]|nr:hypothetical protein [Acetobacteraceae bacterium]MDW8397986.1 hypothetical protein [Acetobacteraceae bacterium]